MADCSGHDREKPGDPTVHNRGPTGPASAEGLNPQGSGWSPNGSRSGAAAGEDRAPIRRHPEGDTERHSLLLKLLRVAALVVLLLVALVTTYALVTFVLHVAGGGSVRSADWGTVLIYFAADGLAFFGVVRLIRVRRRLFSGEVRGLQTRQEVDMPGRTITVWSFRLERYDKNGNRLSPVPVEMRARRFRGSISDGDWLEMRGRLRFGGTLSATRAWNRTTGARVKGKGVGKVGCSFLVLAAIFVFLIILFFLVRACGRHAPNF